MPFGGPTHPLKARTSASQTNPSKPSSAGRQRYSWLATASDMLLTHATGRGGRQPAKGWWGKKGRSTWQKQSALHRKGRCNFRCTTDRYTGKILHNVSDHFPLGEAGKLLPLVSSLRKAQGAEALPCPTPAVPSNFGKTLAEIMT